MRIVLDNIKIECFENELEFNQYCIDNKNDNNLRVNTLFGGKLYDIPTEVRNKFINPNELIVNIKRQNFNDVQYVFIHK